MTKRIDKITEDILSIDVDSGKTLLQLQEEFYGVMRKHTIRQGTKKKNTITRDNFEWTGARLIFQQHVLDRWSMKFTFDDVPEDLEHY